MQNETGAGEAEKRGYRPTENPLSKGFVGEVAEALKMYGVTQAIGGAKEVLHDVMEQII
jgi:hypothetical protein